MKILFVLISMTLLSSCTPKQHSQITNAGQTTSDSRDLIAYEDKARGVVCYRVYGKDGISCLQLNK